MGNTFKKVLSVFLCLVFLLGASSVGGEGVSELIESLSVKASAASYGILSYKIEDGAVTITGCNKSETGILEIPSLIEDYLVTSIGDYAFYRCTGLTSITIPDSVISIGDCAFVGCSRLTSITIPNDVTTIGEWAFNDCSGLTSITIPDNVISIGDCAFSACRGLKSLTIGNGVTSISRYVFSSCDGLTSITIPDSVKNIGERAFSGCTGLTSISIPDSVTSIGVGAFEGCNGLNSILVDTDNSVFHSSGNCIIETLSKTLVVGCKNSIIPDDSSVKIIGDNAFSFCHELKSINIPDSVESIGYQAFFHCILLSSVSIGNTVINIGDSAFAECKELTNINIPDSAERIGDEAFRYCTGLGTITIGNSVASIGEGAFDHCEKLSNINVDSDNSNYSSIDGVLFNKKITKLIRFPEGKSSAAYTIPDGVTKIGEDAFDWCEGVTSVTICNGVTSIDRSAFTGCHGMTSIAIPDSITNIGDFAFQFCTELTDVYYAGNESDKDKISIGSDNSFLENATWHYNSSVSDSPDNPLLNLPEANIIKGNSADNQKIYKYKTSVTFTANVPEGGKVQWYIDGKKAGTDSTLTVKDSKNSYTVTVVVTDKNGNQTMDEEKVTIKNSFFDKLIWFFVHLFNPGAYDIKQ